MERNNSNVAVIILAAGLGKRMQSDMAKVLHKVLGRPMIRYVVETARRIAGNDVIVVVGHQAQEVMDAVSADAEVTFAYQDKQLGTGHAVLCALDYIPESVREIVILCGDVPMLSAGTVQRLLNDHKAAKRDLSLLAVTVGNPKGYGRVMIDENRRLIKIVEEADATPEQKKIRTVNAGIYCVAKKFLTDSLRQIKPNNVQGELYLTDIIEIGYRKKHVVGVLFGDDGDEVMGVNSYPDLLAAEKIMRLRVSKTT
ncbi:MAG: NTP transferase domain-containing protein [Desulfobacterales bacterium]|nr:NTP transferase domain-containing protein [Desulfobacterales bacterium]